MPNDIVKVEEVDVRERPFTHGLLVTLSQGPAVPTRYKDKPNDLLAAILVGKELGVEPMEAINSLFIVKGQVTMTGKLMSALVHRAGHELRVRIDAKKSTVEAWRRDPYTHLLELKGEISFSIEDVKRANLQDKPTYVAYPSVMRTWRALSQCCRIYFADVLTGVSYIPEEVNVEAPLEAVIVDEFAEIEVDGVDLDAENSVAEVINQLDADVVS